MCENEKLRTENEKLRAENAELLLISQCWNHSNFNLRVFAQELQERTASPLYTEIRSLHFRVRDLERENTRLRAQVEGRQLAELTKGERVVHEKFGPGVVCGIV